MIFLFIPLTWTSIIALFIWIQWEKSIQNSKQNSSTDDIEKIRIEEARIKARVNEILRDKNKNFFNQKS